MTTDLPTAVASLLRIASAKTPAASIRPHDMSTDDLRATVAATRGIMLAVIDRISPYETDEERVAAAWDIMGGVVDRFAVRLTEADPEHLAHVSALFDETSLAIALMRESLRDESTLLDITDPNEGIGAVIRCFARWPAQALELTWPSVEVLVAECVRWSEYRLPSPATS